MLMQLRNAVKSWVALLFIALLILSFAVWGLADIFVGRTGEALVSVGDRTIHPADLDRRLDDWIAARARDGDRLGRAQAARDGTVRALLGRMTDEAILLEYADAAGITASADAVARQIGSAPVFIDPLRGGFDREAYRDYLARTGMTAEAFETELRQSLTYEYIAESPALGFAGSETLTRMWALQAGQGRDFAYALVTGADVAQPGDPDETELQAHLAANAETWRIPERRAISLLEISADDFLDLVTPGEEEIAAAYIRRIREFTGPETRSVTRFRAAVRRPVQRVVDLIDGGTPLDEAIALVGDAVSVEEDRIRSDEIGEGEDALRSLFDLGTGAALGPFADENGDGWTGLATRDIEPGLSLPLSEVAEGISLELARRRAEEILYERRDSLYDLVGGGVELEEIALAMGGVVRRMAPVDRGGLTASSALIEALTARPEALRQAFDLAAGETSDLIDSEGTAVLVRLDEVLPSRLPVIDEIRPALAQSWREERRAESIEEASEQFLAATSFEELRAAAASIGVEARRRDQTLDRLSPAPDLDREVIRSVFDAEPGRVVRVRRADGSQIALLVEEVVPPRLDADAESLLENGRNLVSSGLLRDLRYAFRIEVEDEVDLQTSPDRIDAHLRTMTGEP